MLPHRLLSIAAAACTLAALSGCTDDETVTGPAQTPPVDMPVVGLSGLVPPGAVESVILQQDPAPDGTITFVVRVVSKGVKVGAFQGYVSFTRGSLELIKSTAAVANGNSVLLNTEEFGAGFMRFAAFTATSFPGTDTGDGVEAFRFTARLLESSATAKLSATLVAVGSDTGTPLTADQVVASPGVFNVAGKIVQ